MFGRKTTGRRRLPENPATFIPCMYCGKKFWSTGKQKFCSRSCLLAAEKTVRVVTAEEIAQAKKEDESNGCR